MLELQGSHVKLGADGGRGVLAGGGDYHADCEETLLIDGCLQDEAGAPVGSRGRGTLPSAA
jgi:Protein of unknown function (DUF5674)